MSAFFYQYKAISFTKINLKVSSEKQRSFCLGIIYKLQFNNSNDQAACIVSQNGLTENGGAIFISPNYGLWG